ncbi:MAG: transposase [Chloroflexales bacterium]|nr:transposase [Chloroflexales bacterium]
MSVVNPARITGVAQSQLQRNQTDQQDSLVSAIFYSRQRPETWVPPTPAQRHLRALTRQRDDRIQARSQHQHRLRATSDLVIRASLAAVLTTRETQLTAIDEPIQAHLAAHTELQTSVQLLTAIVRIGTVTAIQLAAEF